MSTALAQLRHTPLGRHLMIDNVSLSLNSNNGHMSQCLKISSVATPFQHSLRLGHDAQTKLATFGYFLYLFGCFSWDITWYYPVFICCFFVVSTPVSCSYRQRLPFGRFRYLQVVESTLKVSKTQLGFATSNVSIKFKSYHLYIFYILFISVQ